MSHSASWVSFDNLARARRQRQRKPLKHYLGVDPGKLGGLCVVRSDGEPLAWTRMPEGKARILDWIVRARDAYPRLSIVTELAQAMPKQGVASSFTYGVHFGTFEAVAILLQLPYIEVRPTVWKKAMGLGSAKIDSVTACHRLFPTVALIPEGCRKEHDGIAEALLIAEWGRRRGL